MCDVRALIIVIMYCDFGGDVYGVVLNDVFFSLMVFAACVVGLFESR